MTTTRNDPLTKLGFRFGTNGPHAARTMMFDDLSALFGRLPPDAGRADYAREATEFNCLAKPTKKSRELALRHLSALYGLDPTLAVFRVFRRLWADDEAARRVLSVALALARDPLLRCTQEFILSKSIGESVTREEIEQVIANAYQGRFSAASLKSFAQNINGTWTQAGYLQGKAHKTRTRPAVTPTNLAYALFLGYLEGLRAQRLFSSDWARMLAGSQEELIALAQSASRRGLLVFMNAGGVMEVRFPGYLTQEEEAWLHE